MKGRDAVLRIVRKTLEEARQMNPLQLAYLGDSIWEMLVRQEMIRRGLNVHHMHQHTVALVNAGSQARCLQQILPLLDEDEMEIVRRGRNSHARHAAPRNQHPEDYQAATGLEALFGYLFLTEREERALSLFRIFMEDESHG